MTDEGCDRIEGPIRSITRVVPSLFGHFSGLVHGLEVLLYSLGALLYSRALDLTMGFLGGVCTFGVGAGAGTGMVCVCAGTDWIHVCSALLAEKSRQFACNDDAFHRMP